MRAFAFAMVLCGLVVACDDIRHTIVFVGDSTLECGLGMPAPCTFPDFVESDLSFRPLVEIINVGQGGSSSADWRPDAPPFSAFGVNEVLFERIPERADVVVVYLGINDVLKYFSAPSPNQFAANMQALRDALPNAEFRFHRVTPPPHWPGILPSRLTSYADATEAAFGSEAMIDADLAPEHYLPNDVHLTGAGHGRVADVTTLAISALLP